MGRDAIFTRIVVADDGSEDGDAAATLALRLAGRLTSEVILLGIVESPSAEVEAEGLPVADPSRVRSALEARYDRLLEMGHNLGIQISMEIREGDAARQIVEVAERQHADLIVIGRRHLSRFQRLLQGSTCDEVIRDAPCPVLVVQ